MYTLNHNHTHVYNLIYYFILFTLYTPYHTVCYNRSKLHVLWNATKLEPLNIDNNSNFDECLLSVKIIPKSWTPLIYFNTFTRSGDIWFNGASLYKNSVFEFSTYIWFACAASPSTRICFPQLWWEFAGRWSKDIYNNSHRPNGRILHFPPRWENIPPRLQTNSTPSLNSLATNVTMEHRSPLLLPLSTQGLSQLRQKVHYVKTGINKVDGF